MLSIPAFTLVLMSHGIYDDDYKRHDAISLSKIKDEMRSGALKVVGAVRLEHGHVPVAVSHIFWQLTAPPPQADRAAAKGSGAALRTLGEDSCLVPKGRGQRCRVRRGFGPMHIQVGESSADMLRNASPGGMSSASGMTAQRQDSWGGTGGGGAEDEGVRPALRRT